MEMLMYLIIAWLFASCVFLGWLIVLNRNEQIKEFRAEQARQEFFMRGLDPETPIGNQVAWEIKQKRKSDFAMDA